MHFLHYGVELVNFVDDLDASTLVGVLAWLDYPYVPSFLFGGVPFLFVPLLFLYDGFPPVVVGDEPLVFGVFETLLNVEGQGQILEHIIPDQLVVLF